MSRGRNEKHRVVEKYRMGTMFNYVEVGLNLENDRYLRLNKNPSTPLDSQATSSDCNWVVNHLLVTQYMLSFIFVSGPTW